MKNKGSKYARKHRLETENAQDDKLLDMPEEFVDFFENHYSFEKRFMKLSYDKQISLISCFYAFASSKDDDYGNISSFYLQKLHEITDSDYEEGVYEPVAVDEKRLIRMDCYGSITKRRPDQLSDLYRFFKKRQREKKKHLLREYDIDNAPAWKVMAQFESFRSIESKIKRALYQSQIHPDALKVMTINDFCDVVYNTFNDENDDCEKAYFIKNQNSIKNRYIKQFMKECGDSFYRMLIERGIDERAVKSLCNKMRRFGSCDLDSLVITETHYTKQILKDLDRYGFDVSKIEVGMPIPDKFVNYLIDNNKEHLILARNSDGFPLNKYVLPRLELHHSRAVKFADSGYLAASNYPNRLVLVESLMHQKYYHLFDSILKQNDMQNIFSRLNISNKYMRMRLGFADEDALYCDFENTPNFRQRSIEDKKHRVNYFEMRDEYQQNIGAISKKYEKELRNFGPVERKMKLRKIKIRNNRGIIPSLKKDSNEK